jgi:hypothetical protein
MLRTSDYHGNIVHFFKPWFLLLYFQKTLFPMIAQEPPFWASGYTAIENIGITVPL